MIEDIIVFIVIIIVCGIMWALPLYLTVNFVCWVFGIAFHLSLLQAFALGALANVVSNLLFKKGDK